MPILFGVLTAVLLSLTAFFSWKNHKAYEEQISKRKKQEKIYKGRQDVDQALDVSIAGLIADIEGLDKDIAKLDEEISAQVKKIDDKTAEVEAKESQLKRLTNEVREKEEKLAAIGNVKAFPGKIKALVITIKELEASIKDEEANLANLKEQKADTNAEIARNQDRLKHETDGKSQPYLNTSIKTVYQTWGFVSLNGGDVQGVVPDSILDVIRDGEVVAKLKVTTVEANRAAADIIKDSIKSGIKLRSGDKVKAEEVTVVAPQEGADGEGTPLPPVPSE